MASVERVVILLQGCIFDACGSYHNKTNSGLVAQKYKSRFQKTSFSYLVSFSCSTELAIFFGRKLRRRKNVKNQFLASTFK
jgi:hypothetical protein